MASTLKNVRSLLHPISDRAVRHWLKVQKLPHSYFKREKLYQKIAQLVDDDKIKPEELTTAAIGFEENGAKDIYLLEGESELRSREMFLEHLKAGRLAASQKVIPAHREPRVSTLSYAVWQENANGPTIRAKFSETHINPIPDYESRRFEDKPITKVVVVIHEVETGFTQLRIDKPSLVHDHKDAKGKSNKKRYHEYYHGRMSQILKLSNVTEYNLKRGIDWVAETEPRVMYLPRHSLRTGFDCEVKWKSPGKTDFRDDLFYQGATKADKETLLEQLEGYWLSEQSGDQLKRNLYMGIQRSGRIWFAADCMPQEVDYAISKLRAA